MKVPNMEFKELGTLPLLCSIINILSTYPFRFLALHFVHCLILFCNIHDVYVYNQFFSVGSLLPKGSSSGRVWEEWKKWLQPIVGQKTPWPEKKARASEGECVSDASLLVKFCACVSAVVLATLDIPEARASAVRLSNKKNMTHIYVRGVVRNSSKNHGCIITRVCLWNIVHVCCRSASPWHSRSQSERCLVE